MKIVEFEKKHIESAMLIASSNYQEECRCVTILPDINSLPSLEEFADNQLGVAAIENDCLIGFLCCYTPWDNAFDSKAKGTFSPIQAHGAIKENRKLIYQRMYQVAADKWVKHGITYHAIGHYAHDIESLNAFSIYGFGLRCLDAIRPMEQFECPQSKEISFGELHKEEISDIRHLRQLLSEHMGQSPCFMHSSLEDFNLWLVRAEARDSRLFVARNHDRIVSFMEVYNKGENFVTETDCMLNICGAFCLPEFRGQYIYQNLLNYVITKLKDEGYIRLGVDFESINPTAYNFWLKYFTAYTNSVVRRIDECALDRP